MALQSKLLRGDTKLEAAAVQDSAHIVPGARGAHVGKIQQALIELDGAKIQRDDSYGPATTAAVLAYKQKRNIINPAYQTQADNIIGKMTMARLDSEMLAREQKPVPPGPGPGPDPDPGPTPNLMLNFSLTDPSIYVKLDVAGDWKDYTKKAIDGASLIATGKMPWIDIKVSGKWGRFKVEKKGSIFWVMMFAPEGLINFNKAHVFFHPTPTQVYPDKKGGPPVAHVWADDKGYEAFDADWKLLAVKYLVSVGPQLGSQKKILLIMPMMRTAASAHPTAVNDVFADRPEETLLELAKAARDNLSDKAVSVDPTDLSGGIATSSFSNGIGYHANLFDRLKSSPKYLEAYDFDSTYIKTAHKDISASGGKPNIIRHMQKAGPSGLTTEVHVPLERWDTKSPSAPAEVRALKRVTTDDLHHFVVDYTLHGAIASSLILSG